MDIYKPNEDRYSAPEEVNGILKTHPLNLGNFPKKQKPPSVNSRRRVPLFQELSKDNLFTQNGLEPGPSLLNEA
jgi:hypothetical protein